MLAGTEELSDDAQTEQLPENPANVGIKVESFIGEENKVEQLNVEKGFSNPLFDSTPSKDPILDVPDIEVGEPKDTVGERKELDVQGGFDNLLFDVHLPLSMSEDIHEDMSTLGICNLLADSGDLEATQKG